jgi:hypothetical protein
MMSDASLKKNTACNTCTRRLVFIAYERAPWFRLIREPLKLTMHNWVGLRGVDPREYEVHSNGCYDCTRFYKNELKEQSGVFRLLNSLINPVFDIIMERIVSEKEINNAKAHARAATAGEALPFSGEKYIRDPKWPQI